MLERLTLLQLQQIIPEVDELVVYIVDLTIDSVGQSTARMV